MSILRRISHIFVLFAMTIVILIGSTRPLPVRAIGGIPGVIFVDQDATGANNGSSWGNAYTSLQAALSVSVSGDEIWVADGIYYPGSSRTDTFSLKTGVAVYGGFSGTETVRHQRRWSTFITFLSGDIDPVANNDSYHVVNGSGTDHTAILDGFTITGGLADGESPHDLGGGMYTDGGSPVLRNLVFNSNMASSGGGMYNEDSSPMLINAVFTNNSATDGGGICNANSSPLIVNATFSKNGVTKNGSALANYDNSNPTIANSILWGNKSPSIHQIYDENSTPDISYSDIQGPPKPGPGNKNSDPQFVSPSTGDIRLQASSPAIDAGSNDAVPADTSDLDGDANFAEKHPYDALGALRFVDLPSTPDSGAGASPIVDMGAFEYQYPNNAPLLDVSGDPSLASIEEDDLTNDGSRVSEILDSGAGVSLVSDPDPSYQIGIAVTSAEDSNGVWEYSTDNGSIWYGFGDVSDTSALLLTSEPTDRIRFVPAPNYYGVINPGIAFRGWDGSDGLSSGNRDVDVSINGGGTAYSAATETASITVNPVDDPPSISPIADQSTNIGQLLGPLTLILADVDTPLADLTLSASSSDTNLVAAGNITFGGSEANRSVSLLPTSNRSGVATITITVSDGTSSVEEVFLVTVAGAKIYLPLLLK